MDFDYKKYSLENLENWMHDALSSAEATPQEIYDVIKGVVDENYHMHKVHANRCYELLALLNGNGKGHIKEYDDYVNSNKKSLSCDKDDTSPECKSAWNSFWDSYQGSTVSSVQYTEEELNAMCDKAASDQEKEKCREYNLREAEYYDKRAKLDMNSTYDEMIAAGYEMTADGFWIPPQNEDKVKKWQLPVEMHPSGEYFVIFPDDLLDAANLKEGDEIKWVDNGDGSYTIRKETEEIKMEDC